MRREFDGKTQAVRGALIVDLEELEQWANERLKAVRSERLKQKWAHIVAYIAQTITYIASEYDSSKIMVRLEELERRLMSSERKIAKPEKEVKIVEAGRKIRIPQDPVQFF